MTPQDAHRTRAEVAAMKRRLLARTDAEIAELEARIDQIRQARDEDLDILDSWIGDLTDVIERDEAAREVTHA